MLSEITQLTESHQLLRQLMHQLRSCRDNEVSAAYGRLLGWMEQVFGTEQHLMEKHEFPAAQCHLEQHARVLCAMHKAHAAVMRGDHALGRHVGVTLLSGWFELHNATLDAAVSLWTCCKISPASADFNHASSWIAPETSHQALHTSSHPASRPHSTLWRGPERRSQPRI